MNSVDICNDALIFIGVSTITSLSESTTAAQVCNNQYPRVKKYLLRRHPWNFSIKRSVISPDSGDTPAFGWTYKFTLPSDCLRVLKVNDVEHVANDYDSYRVEGKFILTNQDSVHLEYVSNVEETSFDPAFSEAMAMYMAYKICRTLVESRTVRQECLQAYKKSVSEARFINGSEENHYSFEINDLIEARGGGTGFVRDPGTGN